MRHPCAPKDIRPHELVDGGFEGTVLVSNDVKALVFQPLGNQQADVVDQLMSCLASDGQVVTPNRGPLSVYCLQHLRRGRLGKTVTFSIPREARVIV